MIIVKTVGVGANPKGERQNHEQDEHRALPHGSDSIPKIPPEVFQEVSQPYVFGSKLPVVLVNLICDRKA